MRVTSHAPSPFRERVGVRVIKIKFKINLMSSGRGSFYAKAAQNLNPLGFRIFTRLNLSLLNSCTMCTQTKGGFDNVSSVTITQTCVWVVYFNYTQQHLTYFNTCLFQYFLPLHFKREGKGEGELINYDLLIIKASISQ